MIYEILLAILFLAWIIDYILCFVVGVCYADREEVPNKAFLCAFLFIALTIILNYVSL